MKKNKEQKVSNCETSETMSFVKLSDYLKTGQVYGENGQYVKTTIDGFEYDTKNSTMMGHICDQNGVLISEVYKCDNAPVVFGVMRFRGDKEILKITNITNITNIKFPKSFEYVSLDGENAPSTMIGHIYLDNGSLFAQVYLDTKSFQVYNVTELPDGKVNVPIKSNTMPEGFNYVSINK